MADLVGELLDFTKQQKTLQDIASDSFADTVCSLFRLRETFKVRGGKETKAKFSKLILSFLDNGHDREDEEVENIVTDLLKRCFQYFSDPYVGQQLARFYIWLNKFGEAEKEIKTAIDQMPNNPFFYSTLGLIHRKKIEKVFELADKQNYENALQMITTGLEAIHWFVKAQNLAEKESGFEHETEEGLNSFLQDEVRAALMVLQKCCGFECCSDQVKFYEFINGQESQEFDCLKPSIEGFRKGQPVQSHVNDSLRHLEYTRGMPKRNYSEMRSAEHDRIAKELRKEYNSIYNESNDNFVGETFQALKDRVDKENYDYLKRLSIDVNSSSVISEQHEKKLLVYIGSRLILMSNKESDISEEEYSELLRYSKNLADMQMQPRRMPYIEAYMYLVLFHWPLSERIRRHSNAICHFNYLQSVIIKWKEEYSKRFKKLPRMYFALWKGFPGKDIIDQDYVRREWHRHNKRNPNLRREVKSVDVWNDTLFRSKYVSLKGIVDENGQYIKHEVSIITVALKRCLLANYT